MPETEVIAVRVAEAIRRVKPTLGVGRSTFYRWVDIGAVRTFEIGGVTFVPVTEIDRLLNQAKTQAA